MKLLALVPVFALSALPGLVMSANFALNCGRYPGVCEAKCLGVYAAGIPQTVTWDKATKATKRTRRVGAGANPNPCCRQRINRPPTCWDSNGNVAACTSPDEYPYASTVEGGGNTPSGDAIIRCTSYSENRYEGFVDLANVVNRGVNNGGCGRQAGCQITIGFTGYSINRSPACFAGPGASNDGYTYAFNGQYRVARRSLSLWPIPRWNTVREPVYELFKPREEDFVPLHLRRELLLDNGERVLVGGYDVNKTWEGEVWVMGDTHATVIRELHGIEKTPSFR